MFISDRKDVAREQVKLIATTVNNIGIAIVVLGWIRPLMIDGTVVIADAIAVLMIGAIIHAISLRILTKMPEEE